MEIKKLVIDGFGVENMYQIVASKEEVESLINALRNLIVEGDMDKEDRAILNILEREIFGELEV